MRAALLARRTSRTLLAATYLLAFFAPSQALSVPATVALSADTPYVDYSVTLDGETLFYVTASSGQDCAGWDFAEHVDPYLILLSDTGEVARDDDGNFNEIGDCYSAKLNLTPAAGTYTLRVSSYQHETNMTVPTGSVTLAWSQDGYQPTTTTTTTTTTSTTTTSTTTTTSAPPPEPPSTTTSTTTTTTAAPSTTTSTTSTTTSTTTTTTTEAPPSTTTTSTTTTTTAPPTTTSTTTTSAVPPTTTTTSTTLPPPPTTLPPTTTTRPPATTTSTTTTSTTTTSTTSTTTTTTSAPPTTSTAPPTTTQAPPTTTEPPRLAQALTVAAAIPDEALAAAVVDVIAIEPDEIAVEDVRELIEQPTFDELEPVQLAAVAAAIDDAPVDAKQEFESSDTVADAMFSPALADYTRSDSTIPQSERRTVVAVVAAGAVLAVPRPATPTPSTTGSPLRRSQP